MDYNSGKLFSEAQDVATNLLKSKSPFAKKFGRDLQVAIDKNSAIDILHVRIKMVRAGGEDFWDKYAITSEEEWKE